MTEIRYGLSVDLSSVTVSPFPPRDFSYLFGGIRVLYSQTRVSVSLPSRGLGSRAVTVEGLSPGAQFWLSGGPACAAGGGNYTVTADASGAVSAPFTFSDACVFTLTAIAASDSSSASGWVSLSLWARGGIIAAPLAAVCVVLCVVMFARKKSAKEEGDGLAKTPLLAEE